MGMDISFHPVDVAFIHEHILPFVRGERDIGDLVAQAVRLAKVRYRANAWGLGLLRLDQAMHEMQRKALAKTVSGGAKRGWCARLFSRSPSPAEDNLPATVGVPGFDPQVHVWGRPFFIAHDAPAEISRAIDAYMAAEYHTVDDIDPGRDRYLDDETDDERADPNFDQFDERAKTTPSSCSR